MVAVVECIMVVVAVLADENVVVGVVAIVTVRLDSWQHRFESL